MLLIIYLYSLLLFQFKSSFSLLSQYTDPERDAELREILAGFQAQSSVRVRERVLADLCDSGKFVIMFVCI